MPHRIALAALLLLTASFTARAEAPAEVLVVGTFHMANPGQDIHNAEVDDVLAPKRQEEIAAVVDALARFAPTVVAVEWPAAVASERYAAYRAGTLEPSRNEVVQLGFRLAKQRDLAQVHGLDVDGRFPFEAVASFAAANGQQARIDAAMALGAAAVKEIETVLRERGIAALLRRMNDPARALADHGFYMDMLRIGRGDEQPGAALAAAWAERNLAICARLVQALRPGDRAVVFYGAGHAHWLRRCAIETPGLRLVEANDWLP